MADPKKTETDEEYELLPHSEIEDLRRELKKLRGFDIAPSKNLNVTLVSLDKKIDKLISIFEEAMHTVRVEEGGLSFHDKMKPFIDKMNKILEQNSEIAQGIITLGDMIKELKDAIEGQEESGLEERPITPTGPPRPMGPPRPPGSISLPPMPNIPPTSGLPPPPKRRTFGL